MQKEYELFSLVVFFVLGFDCQDTKPCVLGMVVEFDETGQKLQMRSNTIATVATMPVLVP